MKARRHKVHCAINGAWKSNRIKWTKLEESRCCSPSNKETTMTTLTRTLDRQPPARATSPIHGLVAILFTAFLWSGTAHADLDDIRRAAEAGDTAAQLELGVLFQYGFNYKDNEIPALTWYMLSANQGNAKAVKLRDALKAKMNEKDVQEAMEQVAQYKPKGQVVTPAPATTTAPAQAPELPEFSPAPEAEAPAAEIEPALISPAAP
jgi:hypothetical protein